MPSLPAAGPTGLTYSPAGPVRLVARNPIFAAHDEIAGLYVCVCVCVYTHAFLHSASMCLVPAVSKLVVPALSAFAWFLQCPCSCYLQCPCVWCLCVWCLHAPGACSGTCLCLALPAPGACMCLVPTCTPLLPAYASCLHLHLALHVVWVCSFLVCVCTLCLCTVCVHCVCVQCVRVCTVCV